MMFALDVVNRILIIPSCATIDVKSIFSQWDLLWNNVNILTVFSNEKPKKILHNNCLEHVNMFFCTLETMKYVD